MTETFPEVGLFDIREEEEAERLADEISKGESIEKLVQQLNTNIARDVSASTGGTGTTDSVRENNKEMAEGKSFEFHCRRLKQTKSVSRNNNNNNWFRTLQCFPGKMPQHGTH